jgi:hypothetical protein
MSYNYDINVSNKKKTDQSKYTYKSSEDNSQIFIFELILKGNDTNTIIRKIKKNSYDTLISIDDNINYNTVEKFKLTIIDINNPNKPIILKHHINHDLSTNVFLNDIIYIETYPSNNMMIMNYNIN